MEEIWCRYNTLLDAVTELPIPSEKAKRWMVEVCKYEKMELSDDESALFESLLPECHRDFLQHKNIPQYAIKTSLSRLVEKEEDAKDLWNDAAWFCMRTAPAALRIIQVSMLAYPLVDLAIERRQLCMMIISEIKKGNLKPCFYPDSLEGRGLSDREKLQELCFLQFEQQVMAKVDVNELGAAFSTVAMAESREKHACDLWQYYRNRARGEKIEEQPSQSSEPEILNWKKSFFVDIAGKYAEDFKDADEKYRKKFKVQPTRETFFSRMPEIRPEWVVRIDGKGERREWVFSDDERLVWTNYKRVFIRHFPELVSV